MIPGKEEELCANLPKLVHGHSQKLQVHFVSILLIIDHVPKLLHCAIAVDGGLNSSRHKPYSPSLLHF